MPFWVLQKSPVTRTVKNHSAAHEPEVAVSPRGVEGQGVHPRVSANQKPVWVCGAGTYWHVTAKTAKETKDDKGTIKIRHKNKKRGQQHGNQSGVRISGESGIQNADAAFTEWDNNWCVGAAGPRVPTRSLTGSPSG